MGVCTFLYLICVFQLYISFTDKVNKSFLTLSRLSKHFFWTQGRNIQINLQGKLPCRSKRLSKKQGLGLQLIFIVPSL